MMEIDFFVSYAEEDRRWAEWIAGALEEQGYGVKLRAWDHAVAGINVPLAQDQDLRKAKRLIAVLSPHYSHSAEARSQWAAVHQSDPAGALRKIIPVIVEQGAESPFLSSLAPISLIGKGESSARRTLVESVKAERLKPSRSPAYPGRARPGYPLAMHAASMAPDTRWLLALLFLDAIIFTYGVISYKGTMYDTGDLVRSILFIVLLAITIRATARWAGRRLRDRL